MAPGDGGPPQVDEGGVVVIRFEVQNDAGRVRTWHVEPLGDEVEMAPGDVLSIEIAHPVDLTFEIVLNADSETIWPSVIVRRLGALR